jgi:O-methyltransferase
MTPQQLFEALPRLRDARVDATTTPHSVIIPFATYSPWLDDTDFLRVFATVAEHSLVDIYRCYELWMLAAQARDGDILEVGVWRGGTGAILAARASAATVFLCDTFTGVVHASEHDAVYRGGEHADTSVELVLQLLQQLKLTNAVVLKGIFPEETGVALDERRFALCHVDVDAYESARRIIDWVWPRLNVGGVLVFDDYGFLTCNGITNLVNERFGQPGALLIHNLNGHALVVKT